MGTLRLLEAARRSGVRTFIFASSSAAYGDSPALPKREDMRPEPLSPYASGKLAGEHLMRVWGRVHGMKTVSLRYFNVFGPRQDPSSPYSGVLSVFMKCLIERRPPTIFGDGEQSRDFTYIANVVDANLRAAESGTAVGHVINVANGERVTINEVLEIVKRLTGQTDVQTEYAPARAADVRDSLADLEQARELLGYTPLVGLEEGLRLTIDWWTKSRFNNPST